MTTSDTKNLFLIDGSAIVYRSYFAFIRNPLINSKGENTSATYGFVMMLRKLMREMKPDALAVVFDTPKPTFRHERYAEYKATRQKMPEDLVEQLPRIREYLETAGIPTIEAPGYEADDVMGTLSVQATEAGWKTWLVTGDKDFMQLVNDSVVMYTPKSGGEADVVLDIAGVQEKLGFGPEMVIDYLGLMGDTSDNVPGIPGVGEKTAKKLLAQFGSLQATLDSAETISAKGLRAKVTGNKELALLSRELVTIKLDVPLDVELESFRSQEFNNEDLQSFYREMEFTNLLEELVVIDIKSDDHAYHTIEDADGLAELVKQFQKRGVILTFDLETTGLDPHSADIVGFSFAVKPREAWYVPVQPPHGLSLDEIRPILGPVLADEKIPKCGQNIKYDTLICERHGLPVCNIAFDTMIAGHLLKPGIRQVGLDAMSLEYLQYRKVPTSALIGTGRKQISMRDVPLEQIAEYACEDADFTARLRELLADKIVEHDQTKLFETVEMPLVRVLIAMEQAGVSLDVERLHNMRDMLETSLQELDKKIQDEAGQEFNVKSPKQLGEILFEHLEIHKQYGKRKPRRTKTGFSTDQRVLEQYDDHPLVAALLEHRQLAKLQGTYVDALPKLINPETNRVHTSFNQTIAATGRLSSTDPNLQNIPIRRELGREIRKAFIPRADDWSLISADYSQIELRLLAHLSGDAVLAEAFRSGADIHRETAARMYHCEPSEVTADQRAGAKAINFGIIYGMTEYRLARELGISPDEARAFIDAYFDTYPGVNHYIRDQLVAARERGYVETMLGRRRALPDLHSDNQRIRQNAENIAINTPIQGSAAELIKLAMIRIYEELNRQQLDSLLLLQIHDELILEVPDRELLIVQDLVRTHMMSAMQLSVPLDVQMGVGKSWYDAH
jgi:DNA polymerase I